MSAASTASGWLHWFDRLDTDDAIRKAAYRAVTPVKGLQALPVERACSALDAAWSEVFVPGPRHIEILRMLVDQAKEYSLSVYPTLRDYNRRRSGEIETVREPYPIRCLTGLAGVSKFSLMQALVRICQVTPDSQFVTDSQRLTVHPARRISIQAHLSVRALLKSLANPVAVAGRTMGDVSVLLAHVRDWFQATGTALLIVDEMQFYTQSGKASTKTAQLIMTLASPGIPLVYAANYSLVKKLLERPHEEKDRLLAHPIVLEPPDADSEIWRTVVGEYLAVAPEHFYLEVSAHAHELHRLTAGLFRILRQLLLEAYRVAVGRSARAVTMDDVRQAYRSAAFSSHRKDVEDLASLAVSGLIAQQRADLVCPFAPVRGLQRPMLHGRVAGNVETGTIPPVAMLESTLSIDAQKTLRVLRQAADHPLRPNDAAKVTPLPRRSSISAQTLREGAELLRGTLAKPKPSSAKRSSPSSEPPTGRDRVETS